MLQTAYYHHLPYCTLFLSERQCLKIIWKPHLNAEQIRISLEEVLETIQRNHIKTLISNVSAYKGSWNSSKEWISSVWLPQALQNGLRKVAFVVAESVLQKMSVEHLKNKLQNHHQTLNLSKSFKIFYQEEEAKEWLHS
ncbi:MAG: STAS/SEC14 domain-containing protein [Thermonemataceae bacterium]|nr:STAS/SEC14 domain-containing protein [Thermonemataceae bacterium]